MTLPPEVRAAHAVRLALVARAKVHPDEAELTDRHRTLIGTGTRQARQFDVLSLHSALLELARLDERQALVAELRVFGGLTTQQVAQVLDMSTHAAEDDWVMARTWMFSAMSKE